MTTKLFDISGKVAIVTGAARGLGSGIALGYADEGARVVVADLRETTETATAIRAKGGQCHEVIADVSTRSGADAIVREAIDKFGRVDILVNNAGIYPTEVPTEEVTEELWDNVMSVNLKSQLLCSQAAFPHMKAQGGGKIINFSSIAGFVVFAAGGTAYAASKAAVLLLTKNLAKEWGKYGINVNAICPAFFLSQLTKDFFERYPAEAKAVTEAKVPLGRPAELDEMVGTAIYLASKASDYVTGHAIVIDGGTTLGV